MQTDEAAGGEGGDPRLARLPAKIGPRLRAPKEELVTEIEAHLTDLLSLDFDEALRAVAAAQTINRIDGAGLYVMWNKPGITRRLKNFLLPSEHRR